MRTVRLGAKQPTNRESGASTVIPMVLAPTALYLNGTSF